MSNWQKLFLPIPTVFLPIYRSALPASQGNLARATNDGPALRILRCSDLSPSMSGAASAPLMRWAPVAIG